MGRGKYFLGVNKKDYYLFDILLTQFVCHFASKSKLQAQHACTHTHTQTDRQTDTPPFIPSNTHTHTVVSTYRVIKHEQGINFRFSCFAFPPTFHSRFDYNQSLVIVVVVTVVVAVVVVALTLGFNL